MVKLLVVVRVLGRRSHAIGVATPVDKVVSELIILACPWTLSSLVIFEHMAFSFVVMRQWVLIFFGVELLIIALEINHFQVQHRHQVVDPSLGLGCSQLILLLQLKLAFSDGKLCNFLAV